MQKRKSKENPDDGTQDGKQCIQHTRGGFGGFAGPIPDITSEKEEESGYDAARQQKILGNPEEIDLRKPDQRPMAEKGRQHDIRRSEKASINATVKTATEQGITGEVIIGKVRPRASEKSG